VRIRASAALIVSKKTFEVRLLDLCGRTLKVYRLSCRSEAEALSVLESIDDASCVRYELWLGMAKLSEGRLLDVRHKRLKH